MSLNRILSLKPNLYDVNHNLVLQTFTEPHLQRLKEIDAVLTNVSSGLNDTLEKINYLYLHQGYKTWEAETIGQLNNGQTLTDLECRHRVCVEVLQQDVERSHLYTRERYLPHNEQVQD